MKLVKRLLDITYFSFIGILCITLLGNICGIKTYITMSGSMEPTIKTGSICIVDTNIKYEKIQKNDVIVFELVRKKLVTHRVIAITDEGIETKGDNNDISDGISTTRENFVGKTLFSIPYIGYVISKFQNRYVIMVIVSVIIVMIVFMGIDKLVEEKDVKLN